MEGMDYIMGMEKTEKTKELRVPVKDMLMRRFRATVEFEDIDLKDAVEEAIASWVNARGVFDSEGKG